LSQNNDGAMGVDYGVCAREKQTKQMQ